MIVFLSLVIHIWCYNLQEKSCKDSIRESCPFEFMFQGQFFFFTFIILTMYLIKYLCDFEIDYLRVKGSIKEETF